MASLFGKSKSKDPKEQINLWTSKMRSESRQLDRQMRAIQREQEKTIQMLKETVKKPGDNKHSLSVLAKELVRSRKAITRLHCAKAEINSIIMAMKNQLSVSKMVGSIDKSTQIMKSLGRLNKLPETMATMQEMSREMIKTGIIEEMMEDTFETLDSNLGLDDADEEIQREVDNVLYEITKGQIGRAAQVAQDEPSGLTAVGSKTPKKATAIASTTDPNAPSTAVLKGGSKPYNNSPAKNESTPFDLNDAENEEEVKNMRDRLHALRN